MEIRRLKFGDWIKLSDLKEKIGKQGADVADLVFRQLALCFPITVEHRNLDWWEIADAYLRLSTENKINQDFPIVKIRGKDDSIPEFDYEGRSWYFWTNILSSKYGWSLEYIGELDPDDVFGLFMEILISDHEQKEFDYRLSELAYKYNEKTKKSTYVPLSKPRWMRSTNQEIKVPIRRYRKDMRPAGVVIKIDHEDKNKDSKLS